MTDTTDPHRGFRAVFTVTIETRKGGDYYFDHADFVRHVGPWIEGDLDDRDDIRTVTITEQPADRAELSGAERQFLTFALDLAADQMASRGNEFGAEDTAALEKLRGMADGAQQPKICELPHLTIAEEDACEQHRLGGEAQQPETQGGDESFGTADCTCIPFVREGGTARYCRPGDTVDQISGWERGGDCPHHRPTVVVARQADTAGEQQ
jgi:hypothetical protein